MEFSQFIASGRPAIAEGAVVERIRRDPDLALDPHILNGGLIYESAGRARLAEIHRRYMKSAHEAGLPILTFTDTWRCSQTLVQASRFRDRAVNEDNVRFLRDLRADLRAAAPGGPPIFIGGLVGPSTDAYQPAGSLTRATARDFHRQQIEALASAGVDYLFLATAPAVDEALGIADVMAETRLPYILSFVIRRTGTVLDGTPLGQAMIRIDSEVAQRPIGYAVNCVHARVLAMALEKVAATHADALQRLLAFQANTGDREIEQLDGSEDLLSEPPDTFADGLERLRHQFNLRVLGGCCGTDHTHIDVLARRLACEAVQR
jgi:homocysteine S-methyltransferase